jgi:hypothetical protein
MYAWVDIKYPDLFGGRIGTELRLRYSIGKTSKEDKIYSLLRQTHNS